MTRWTIPALLLAVLAVEPTVPAALAADGEALESASEFRSIADKAERSAALFTEAGRVLMHARCVNCHPTGDSPLQGEAGAPHEPPVRRGRGGLGVVGMQCKTCHQRENFEAAGVPGAPAWHLAPRSMAWEDLSLAEICEQLKDPARNGNRTVDEIVEHMSEDALVGWAWSPGGDLEPAPGVQETFGGLIAAWARTGAVCPD